MKKSLAILLAVMMLAGTAATTLAYDEEWEFGTPTSISGDGTGGSLVVNFDDDEILIATFPTDRSFDFWLDQHGIYGMSDEDIEALGVLKENGNYYLATGTDLLDTAGQIVFRGTAAPYVINQSNIEIAVEIEFDFDADGAGINLVNDPDEVEGSSATPTSMAFIGATFSENAVEAILGTETSITSFSGDVTLPIDANASQTSLFVFEETPYSDEIISSGGGLPGGSVDVNVNAIYEGPGKGTQFVLSGECDPYTNWTEVIGDAELALYVTYTLREADDNDLDADEISGAYGLREGDLDADDYIDYTIDELPNVEMTSGTVGFRIGGAVSGTATSATVTGPVGGPVDIPFNFGDYGMHAIHVGSITGQVVTSYFDRTANSFVLKADPVWSAGTHTVLIYLLKDGGSELNIADFDEYVLTIELS